MLLISLSIKSIQWATQGGQNKWFHFFINNILAALKTCLIISDYLYNIFLPNLLYNFIHKVKDVVCYLRYVGSVNWRMVYHASIITNHEIEDRISSPRTPTITHDFALICKSFSLQCGYIHLKLLHLLLQICISNLKSYGTFDA